MTAVEAVDEATSATARDAGFEASPELLQKTRLRLQLRTLLQKC
jgi:hypothetical protein